LCRIEFEKLREKQGRDGPVGGKKGAWKRRENANEKMEIPRFGESGTRDRELKKPERIHTMSTGIESKQMERKKVGKKGEIGDTD